MKLKLKIIDLDGVYFDSEVDLLNVTIASGNVTILANHLPLISSIDISRMYIKEDGVITNFAIAGGTLFVSESECKVITSAVEKENDIDFTRAEQARKRAEVALKRALNRLSFR